MKNPHLSNDQVSRLCLELSLLLHAGISVDDGMHLLLEDKQNDGDRAVLEHLSRQLDDGTPSMRRWNPPARFRATSAA